MISGLVYFEEIIKNVKDDTGISNMRPLYEKIQKSILNAENDIGAGGLIVRKKRTFINGDGYYNGTYLTLPYDLMGEYSKADFNTVEFRGDKLEVITPPGPDEIDLVYMGILMDEHGNPISTRNHLDAVVARCVRDLYRPKIFLGTGSRNIFKDMKDEYDNLVLASRGNSVFPSKDEWTKIGETLSMSYADVMMDCGLSSINEDMGSTGAELGETADPTPIIDMVAVFEANLTP